MGFLDKAKQAAEQAKVVGEQAAKRANEMVENAQRKRQQDEPVAPDTEPTEAVEQPLSGAGPGAS